MKETIIRGKLLKLLKDLYPDGMEHATILGIYYQYFKVDIITKALCYLADKGYILRKEEPHPYKVNRVLATYKITPHGIDLVDKNIPADPGILLDYDIEA